MLSPLKVLKPAPLLSVAKQNSLLIDQLQKILDDIYVSQFSTLGFGLSNHLEEFSKFLIEKNANNAINSFLQIKHIINDENKELAESLKVTVKGSIVNSHIQSSSSDKLVVNVRSVSFAVNEIVGSLECGTLLPQILNSKFTDRVILTCVYHGITLTNGLVATSHNDYNTLYELWVKLKQVLISKDLTVDKIIPIFTNLIIIVKKYKDLELTINSESVQLSGKNYNKVTFALTIFDPISCYIEGTNNKFRDLITAFSVFAAPSLNALIFDFLKSNAFKLTPYYDDEDDCDISNFISFEHFAKKNEGVIVLYTSDTSTIVTFDIDREDSKSLQVTQLKLGFDNQSTIVHTRDSFRASLENECSTVFVLNETFYPGPTIEKFKHVCNIFKLMFSDFSNTPKDINEIILCVTLFLLQKSPVLTA